MQQPTYAKEIVYNPETRDFNLLLDGIIVGFARTYSDGERALDRLVYELLSEAQDAAVSPAEAEQAQADAAHEATAARMEGDDGVVTLCDACRRASALAGEDMEWDCLHDIAATCGRCGGTEVLANVRPHRFDEPHAVVSAANCPYPVATYVRAAQADAAHEATAARMERTDAELVAAAGGWRDNPYFVREWLGEITIIDRRTNKYVDTCERGDPRAHTMSAEARRLWVEELRAAEGERLVVVHEDDQGRDEYCGCVRCAEPATMTVRIGSGDLLMLCRPCFERHYQQNERAQSWGVVYPDESTGPRRPTCGSDGTPCEDVNPITARRLAAEAAAPTGTCAGCGGPCASDELYCSTPCLDAFDAPLCCVCGEHVATVYDEDDLWPSWCGNCAPDAEDVPTPEQQAQRDAENEADMLDFVQTSDLGGPVYDWYALPPEDEDDLSRAA